ncbi:MAG: hypothetical protein EOO39_08355 [Cytophagaceae bacterium]|nr:MAG: hypothetical protein EOO39_08355 [Cytophagaceae bacterium]
MPYYTCPRCKKEFFLSGSLPTAKCFGCRQPCQQKAKAPVQVIRRQQTQPTAVLPNPTPLTVSNPVQPKQVVVLNQRLPNEVIKLIITFCDERTLAMFSMVCKKFKPFACDVLTRFVPQMMAYGSTTHNLKEVIKEYIQRDIGAQHTLRLAVDKFPYNHSEGSILSCIIKNRIPIDLLLGTNDSSTIKSLTKVNRLAKTFIVSGAIHKMHNKVWTIDGEGIIIGSPNVSYSGLESINFESCIYIKSPRMGHLVGQYMDLLKSPNPGNNPLWDEIGEKLVKYNSENHHLQVALSPIIDIQKFVIEHLHDATKIIIRQFLISPGRRENRDYNIVDFLCYLSRKEGADIEIFIDDSAYRSEATGYFVKEAVTKLMRSGVKVYLQKPVTVIRVNEALQHDKLILAELRSGKQITLMGSAGFTSAVIANENAERFIYTDVTSVYESMMLHHTSTLNKGKGVTLTLK